MWAAHSDSGGRITGWEERGRNWRGFARAAPKSCSAWAAGSLRICITEAAIDAMSLAAIEVLRPDTLYVSTGGGGRRRRRTRSVLWPGAPMSSCGRD